jgi:Xaa-Pro aminopeptidase
MPAGRASAKFTSRRMSREICKGMVIGVQPAAEVAGGCLARVEEKVDVARVLDLLKQVDKLWAANSGLCKARAQRAGGRDGCQYG